MRGLFIQDAQNMTRLIVWYDQSCPLCRREIALMRRLDWLRNIKFIDAADPNAVCPLEREQLLARFHALENGKMLAGASAFAAMWRAIPLLWPLGMMARIPGAERLLEWSYGYFLTVRPRLQSFFK
jgi:predicted DCC family thiol-disulfide oxidoreductase YuxK